MAVVGRVTLCDKVPVAGIENGPVQPAQPLLIVPVAVWIVPVHAILASAELVGADTVTVAGFGGLPVVAAVGVTCSATEIGVALATVTTAGVALDTATLSPLMQVSINLRLSPGLSPAGTTMLRENCAALGSNAVVQLVTVSGVGSALRVALPVHDTALVMAGQVTVTPPPTLCVVGTAVNTGAGDGAAAGMCGAEPVL